MNLRRLVPLVVVAATLALAGCTASEPSTPRTSAPGPTRSSAPSPTPTADASVQPTCQNIATAAFLSEMATAGWVPVAVPDSSSFDGFPGGRPSRSISCTWSADPTVGTDNVAIRAWAAIDPATASAAIQHYVDAGWTRVDAPEGTYVGVKGDGGPVSPDAEGFNETYLFTKTDVRFADSKASLKDVKAPTEAG